MKNQYKKPQKIDERIGIKYTELVEKQFGSKEDGLQGQIRYGKTGDGFIDIRTKEFGRGFQTETLNELPKISEFAPSKSDYLISERRRFIETEIAPDLAIKEPFTQVKVSKSTTTVTRLKDLPDKEILSIAKGEFFKQSKSLTLYEEPKVKTEKQKIEIPKIKEKIEIKKPQDKINEENINGKTTQIFEELKTQDKIKEYEPIVGVLKVKPETKKTFTPKIQTYKKELDLNFKTDFSYNVKSQKDFKSSQEQKTIQIKKEIKKPTKKEETITETKRISSVKRLPLSISSIKSAQKLEEKTISELKSEQKYDYYKSNLIKKPFSFGIPKISLKTKKKKLGKRLVAGYKVFTKRFGKEKLLFKDVTKEEAFAKGGQVIEKTLARTLILRPSGLTEQKDIKGRFNLFKYRQKKPNIYVQKSKFALGTRGEVGEIGFFRRLKK